MAKSSRHDLFVNVGGNISNLDAAMKAGRSVLNQFGANANATVDEVQKAFAELGGATVAQSTRSIEKSYDATFRKIRANAQAVLNAPTGAAAVQILDAGAARQSAEAAERQANALRMVADAANRAATSTTGDAAAARVYATAAEAAATGATQHATALRNQATLLDSVESELRQVAAAQDATEATGRKVTTMTGAQKAGMQQLSFQLNDVAVQTAAGTPPMMVFSMQISQVVQALSMMNTGGNKFLNFLGGAWGMGVTAAATVLAPLVIKLFESNDAVEKGLDKLKKDAVETENAAKAKDRFAASAQGVAAAIDDSTNALKKSAEQEIASVERTNMAAAAERSKEIAIRKATKARLEDERALLKAQIERARAPGQSSELAALSLPRLQAQVDATEAELAAQTRKVIEAEANVQRTRVDLANDAAQRAADPIKRITKLYDDQALAIRRAARAQADAGKSIDLLGTTRQLAAIERQKQAALKAEQDRQSAATRKAPALGDQLDTERGQRLLSSAQRYNGLSERTAGGTSGLKGLFAEAGISVDPKMTAWCAAFVNAVLATNGLPGTGSLAARSFLNYGEKTDKPERGDIVVLKRGTGSQGHVGFYAGTGPNGRVMVTGGNQGDKVSTTSFARSDVLGFRRAPSAADAASAAEKSARAAEVAEQKRISDAAAYADLMMRAQGEQLDLTRQRTTDIATAAGLDRQSIEIERQRLDAAAQLGVEKGRWTWAEADGLKAVYRRNAEQQVLEIRDREGVALLDQQLDADRERLARSSTLLQMQADFATTDAQRKDIAQRILANEEAELRARAVRLIASNDPADWARGEGMLQQIEDERPYRQRQLDRQFATPRERYRDELTRNVGDIDEALAGVEARGLRSIEDGLTDILSGTEDVAGAFKKMAASILGDLARVAAQKLILSVIGGSFAGGGKIEGFSTGGRISGPGTGTSDSILAMVGGQKPILVSNGESIVNAQATARYWPMIDAMNRGTLDKFASGGLVSPSRIYQRRPPSPAAIARGSAAGGSPIVFDLRGALTTEAVLGQINALVARHAQVSILAGSQMAQQEIAEESMRMIPS